MPGASTSWSVCKTPGAIKSTGQSTKSVMARSSFAGPFFEVRVFRTAALDCSRSGSARTRLGGGHFFFRDFGIGDGLLGPSPVSMPESPRYSVSRGFARVMLLNSRAAEGVWYYHVCMRLGNLFILSVLALSAQDSKFTGPSDANPPVSKGDIVIVRRVREILKFTSQVESRRQSGVSGNPQDL
jgi:hypothetical protein